MSIERLTGRRAADHSRAYGVAAPVFAPTTAGRFARTLEARRQEVRERVHKRGRSSPLDTATGNAPQNSRSDRCAARPGGAPRQERARATSSIARVCELAIDRIDARDIADVRTGTCTKRDAARRLHQCWPALLAAHARDDLRSRFETTVEIDGLGRVVVTAHRERGRWVVTVAAPQMITHLTGY